VFPGNTYHSKEFLPGFCGKHCKTELNVLEYSYSNCKQFLATSVNAIVVIIENTDKRAKR